MLIDSPKTPPELAKLCSVKADTVRAWIEAGLLEAVNFADPKSTRPRWRIMPEAWEAFLRSRSSRNKGEPVAKRRRKSGDKPKLKYCSL